MRAGPVVALVLLAGCGQASPPPETTGVTVEAALSAYTELERRVAAGRKDEWRRCAAFVQAEDGAARGRADAARGERVFLTHVEGGLGVSEVEPGVSGCTPRDDARHSRYPTLSVRRRDERRPCRGLRLRGGGDGIQGGV